MLGLRFYTNDRHPQSWFTDGNMLDWAVACGRAGPGLPVSLGAAMFLPLASARSPSAIPA